MQTTLAVSVVGVQHRKADAKGFAKAARKAEAKRLQYGVQLEHQPNNRHDRNAIAVYGVAERKGWFRSGVKEWHIGYLDRELAAELVEDLVSKTLPVAAELYLDLRRRRRLSRFQGDRARAAGHGGKGAASIACLTRGRRPGGPVLALQQA